MRWDAVLHPVGPLPVAAYWLRRAVVLVGVIILLVILSLILGALGGGSKPTRQAGAGISLPTPDLPSPTPGASGASAAPASASPSPAVTLTCADAALSLTIATGAPSYPSASLPQFVVTVTNTGAVACRRDLSTKATVITVVSGTDRIWSSGDCPSVTPDLRTLAPGATVKLTSSWDRLRSLPGCATTGAAGQTAKTGVYVASVTLGMLKAAGTASFHLS